MPRYRIRRRLYYYDVLETPDVPSREDALDAVERGDYNVVEDETFDYTADTDNWEIEAVQPPPPVIPRRNRVAILADAAADARLDMPTPTPLTPADLNDITRAVRNAGLRAAAIPVPIDDSVEDVQFEDE